MHKHQALRRTVKGKPYLFTRNERGWGVVSLESPAARLSRSYQVVCGSDLEAGRPLSCSCPSCWERRQEISVNGRTTIAYPYCKHMREATRIYYEQHPETAAELRGLAVRLGFQG